jgi:myosin heavy subunit
MTAVDSDMFPSSNVVRTNIGSVQTRFENLQLLINRIVEFYKSSLQHLVVSALPDVSLIAQDPENDKSLDELEKLMMLLLGCVVQCDNKEPLIEAMKTMENTDQHALVAYIQQVTETTSYVCSYDWTSFKDMTKENVEALCQAAFDHLFYMSTERHRLHKLVSEVTLERNFFREAQQRGMSASDIVSPMITKQLVMTPSPQINQEVMELRTKVRNLQEQLDRKVDSLADNTQQLDQAKSMIQKLQQEKRDLFEKVHSQQVYKDEMETLQAQASKCDRLESEVQRYKKKAEDAEYMKKRIEELIHQNELMVETKALLEEKAASLATRAEAYDELQTEIASLKVQLESLNQEKEIDIKRMEEFISQSARLELQNASLHEKVSSLESMLEVEQEKGTNESTSTHLSWLKESFTEQSNLSFEIKEADVANKTRLARLEKESAELERVREELRTSNAKVAELEKTTKKLNEQAHLDKKNIIKVNEVLCLCVHTHHEVCA